jgi:hypothetical protein
MITVDFDASGFDIMRKALEEMPRKSVAILEKAMKKSCLAITGELAEYPPATEANSPGRMDKHGRPMGYYERGRGWWYPVKKKATLESGRMEGKILKTRRAFGLNKQDRLAYGAIGYRLSRHNRSQVLGKHWTTKTVRMSDGIEGQIGNSASYAKYVHIQQPVIFKVRKWRTINQAIDAATPDIHAALAEAVTEMAKLLGGNDNGSTTS